MFNVTRFWSGSDLVLTWFTGGQWWCYSDNFFCYLSLQSLFESQCWLNAFSMAAWTERGGNICTKGSESYVLYNQNNELKDTKLLCCTELSSRVEVTVRSWFTTSHITQSFVKIKGLINAALMWQHLGQNQKERSGSGCSGLSRLGCPLTSEGEKNCVNILAQEDRWFERGVKESICGKLEWPSLNGGGDLRHYLSPTYNAALNSLSRQINNHSHLGSPSPNNPHEGQLGQQPTSGLNDSETQSSHVSITIL